MEIIFSRPFSGALSIALRVEGAESVGCMPMETRTTVSPKARTRKREVGFHRPIHNDTAAGVRTAPSPQTAFKTERADPRLAENLVPISRLVDVIVKPMPNPNARKSRTSAKPVKNATEMALTISRR